MSERTILPDPMPLPMPSLDALKPSKLDSRAAASVAAMLKERDAFDAMFSELLQQFDNQYVAVYQGRVVANGDDQFDVAKRAYKTIGYVPMYIGRVSTVPEPPSRVYTPFEIGN